VREADVPKTITPQRPAGLATRFASALKAALLPSYGETEQLRSYGDPVNRRHQEALAVLTAARGVISRGWVQRAWYVTETPAGRRRAGQRFFPGRLDHAKVVEACLIGAVMHAGWQQSSRAEYSYPAIDALWHALFDATPRSDADPIGAPCPPLVRAARVRDLTTWNDRIHRTRGDVLQLLDRAASRLATSRVEA
jgi:hypothetical protein